VVERLFAGALNIPRADDNNPSGTIERRPRSLVCSVARIFVMIHGPTGVPRAYWHEIAVILAAKAVALALIYLLFFAAPAPVPALGDHLFYQGSRK
jgi:hypothetical protein